MGDSKPAVAVAVSHIGICGRRRSGDLQAAAKLLDAALSHLGQMIQPDFEATQRSGGRLLLGPHSTAAACQRLAGRREVALFELELRQPERSDAYDQTAYARPNGRPELRRRGDQRDRTTETRQGFEQDDATRAMPDKADSIRCPTGVLVGEIAADDLDVFG